MILIRRTAVSLLFLLVVVGLSAYPQATAQGPGGVKIDWTVSFGTVLHLLGLVITMVLMYTKLVQRIAGVET